MHVIAQALSLEDLYINNNGLLHNDIFASLFSLSDYSVLYYVISIIHT